MDTLVLKSFKRTKHIPIDESFNIDTLENLNIRIPLPIRYEGLIFFAIAENKFYYFDSDLTVAKELLTNTEIHEIGIEESDYADMIEIIESVIPNPIQGQLIYLTPLNIIIGYTGSEWVYICGEYHLSDVTYWGVLPNNFKQRKVRVLDTTNEIYYIVGENGNIRDLYRVFTVMPSLSDIENGEIFTYIPNVSTIRVFIKTANTFVELTTSVLFTGTSYIENHYDITPNNILFNQNEVNTYISNIVTHNLDTTNVKVWFIDSNNMKFDVGIRYIDNNNIQLLSADYYYDCTIIVETLMESSQL